MNTPARDPFGFGQLAGFALVRLKASVPLICLWALSSLPAVGAEAQPYDRPFLSPVFGDNMVLQRDKPNRIWGWTEPGGEVGLEVDGRTTTTVAGADGRWEATFDPPAVGGPYQVTISGPETVELHNVLVGDVWLCGGQSNMAVGLNRVDNGEEEIQRANFPEIRLFAVGTQSTYGPASTIGGSWQVCSPETMGSGRFGFSAVAYFFGRRVHQEIGVPIGLIQDCLGGTTAESWMSSESLDSINEIGPQIREIARLRGNVDTEYGSFLMHWLDEFDLGSRENPWQTPDLDDSDWEKVNVPGGFGDLGLADVPGVGWFRGEIELPDPLPEGRARLFLGAIYKMDTTYINGTWVGASSWADNPRRYFVPEGVLHGGTNQIAIRVFKKEAGGGFPSDPAALHLDLGDGTVVPLAGEWRGKISADARPPHPLPLDFENYPTMPTVMFNGMIAPLAPLAIRGALWYQGEANFLRAHQYRKLLPALIADWRRLFQQGDFPFYIVSLPAFMERRDEPVGDGWAELREAQFLTAKTVPNTALVVTVDTGDAEDIHPSDKLPVGERAALCALGEEYGRDVVWKGPMYSSFEIDGSEVRIHFDGTDGGLVVHGDELAEFSIAGEERQWHWADARIVDGVVVVSSPEVPAPKAVRYAWQANPVATLFNGAGLPAAPFRTDDWPGISLHK